jgi:hypothetical protein
MKFISTWTVLPGALKETVDRFLAGQGQPPKGVTLMGRWHKVDCSGGYVLFETNDATAFYESAAVWADVLQVHTAPVVDDAEAGPVLAKVFKK